MASSDNSFGIASVILGILSLVCALAIIFGSLAGIILAIISLIFALKQRKIAKNSWAKWGIALSIIGLILNIVVFFILISTIVQYVKQIQELQASGALSQYGLSN